MNGCSKTRRRNLDDQEYIFLLKGEFRLWWVRTSNSVCPCWHGTPWSPPWAHFFKKICQTCIYLFLFLLLYTVGLVAWERLEIVDVTCVPRTISPLPIRGDNQPNPPVGGRPTRGIDLAFAPFGLYARISPLPCPSAYLSSCLYAYVTINASTILLHIFKWARRSARLT